jgi:hypothetical protein
MAFKPKPPSTACGVRGVYMAARLRCVGCTIYHAPATAPRRYRWRGSDWPCLQCCVSPSSRRALYSVFSRRRRRLYGITCLQTFSYYVDHDHADRKFLRGLVSARPFLKPTSELTSPARQVAVIMCVFCVITFIPADVVFSRLLDTVHLGLVLHAVYWYTVSTYGEEQELNYIVWCKCLIHRTCSYGAHA